MPIIRQPLALSTEFAESVACHAIDKYTFGFFTIAQKLEGARTWQERSHRLEDLPKILRTVGASVDTYISQAAFASPNRRIANLARVGLLWVDLDIYNVPAFTGMQPEHIVPLLLQACEDRGLPAPSVIISSGMGLYAKWFLENPIPARALSRWQLVQNTLCDRLSDFGADTNARDASRVLRIVDTVHKESGRPVSVLWENTMPTHGGVLVNGIAAHSFDVLADELLPLTREQLAELRAQRDLINIARDSRRTATGQDLTLVRKPGNTNGLRTFIPSQLAWDRYHDIIKLAQIRGWERGAPEGQRDMPVFLASAFMAQAVVVPQFHLEVAAIARRFAPTWTDAEVQSCVSSVLARAVAASKGESIVYKGQLRDPRYIFKNQTLLALLNVTPEEEQQLTTIVSPGEAQRRDAERSKRARQLAGAVDRAKYLQDAEQKRSTAKLLREQGKSWKEVGGKLGVSAGAARMLAARIDVERTSPSVYM
jgi:hypothetical protein